ncbi:MAG TPA: nucleotide sugar dehydrogenase [Nitrospiria bacterium]|nr:nucleotide sugar dehydrogenase [Nitrospiria bacterium]
MLPAINISNSNPKNLLLKKIQTGHAKSGVIGLGYIGLPLAIEMARAGIEVTGIEINPVRVETLLSGRSYLKNVPSSLVSEYVGSGKLTVTGSIEEIKSLDIICISVPTPYRKTQAADYSIILNLIRELCSRVKPGQLIVLESTTSPGTMDNLIAPLFRDAGFEIGEDLFLAYSPVREDPGNRKFKHKTIPKVLGGYSSHCTEIAALFYSQFVDKVVPVSSAKVAEMVKFLENTFRSVNIAMINEISKICHKLNVNVWEVIETAKTKPFGFMPFYPGPGLGESGNRVDSVYQSLNSGLRGLGSKFIDLAGQINSSMPEFIIVRINQLLNSHRKSLAGSKIMIIGMAYKKDVEETSESPAIEVAKLLKENGADLRFYDPFVQQVSIGGEFIQRTGLENGVLKSCDLVVILTDHSGVDYKRIAKYSKLIFDTRNAMHRLQWPQVVRL